MQITDDYAQRECLFWLYYFFSFAPRNIRAKFYYKMQSSTSFLALNNCPGTEWIAFCFKVIQIYQNDKVMGPLFLPAT